MKFSDNGIASLEKYFRTQLSQLYPEREVQSLFELTIEHLFEIDKKYLLLNPGLKFSESQLLDVISVVKELKTGKPFQYITGSSEFFGLKLSVNESVLIPRPETEELVRLIIGDCGGRTSGKLLDIGTGSGCIALALKDKLPFLNVIATDISGDAIETAMKNARSLNLDVEFLQDNIFETGKLNEYRSFDIIVSNPPYVLSDEKQELHKNVVAFEPHAALFVPDDNALVFYIAIAEFAIKKLSGNGKIYFEINENYGRTVFDLLAGMGFQSIQLKKDLSGKDRIVSATSP